MNKYSKVVKIMPRKPIFLSGRPTIFKEVTGEFTFGEINMSLLQGAAIHETLADGTVRVLNTINYRDPDNTIPKKVEPNKEEQKEVNKVPENQKEEINKTSEKTNNDKKEKVADEKVNTAKEQLKNFPKNNKAK